MSNLTWSATFLVPLVPKWYYGTNETNRKLVLLVPPPYRVGLVGPTGLSGKVETTHKFRRFSPHLKTVGGAIC